MQRTRWFGLILLLGVCTGWAEDRPLLRLDEDHVRIRLLPTPLLELPVVNNAGKGVEGTFRLEFLDRDAVPPLP